MSAEQAPFLSISEKCLKFSIAERGKANRVVWLMRYATVTNNCDRNPNVGDVESWSAPYWPAHTAAKKEYLTLDTNSSEIGNGPRVKQCTFWKKYLPHLLSATCEYPPPSVTKPDHF